MQQKTNNKSIPHRWLIPFLASLIIITTFTKQPCQAADRWANVWVGGEGWGVGRVFRDARLRAGSDKDFSGIGAAVDSSKKEKEVTFTTEYTPNFDNARIVVHSDDGVKIECRVQGTNGYETLHDRLTKGQSFPTFIGRGGSFFMIKSPNNTKSFTKGVAYEFRVTYTNKHYKKGGYDTDGLTLYICQRPLVTVKASSPNAFEDGLKPGQFTVERFFSGPALTVKYTVSGTATEGTDYTTLSKTVTIPKGKYRVTISVTPKADTDEEPDETVKVTLVADTKYGVDPENSATVYIEDKNKKVDIDADINRNGEIKDDTSDETGEESIGIIIIADKDNVYKVANTNKEPAKRRKIILRNDSGVANEKVVIKRTGKLKLYKSQATTDQTELFQNNDEITLTPGTYWVQGSNTPSTSIRNMALEISRGGNNPKKYFDKVTFTNLWVTIKAHNGLNSTKKTIDRGHVYDGYSEIKGLIGHGNLGVHRSARDSLWSHGTIQIDGSIQPSNFVDYSYNFGDVRMPQGWN